MDHCSNLIKFFDKEMQGISKKKYTIFGHLSTSHIKYLHDTYDLDIIYKDHISIEDLIECKIKNRMIVFFSIYLKNELINFIKSELIDELDYCVIQHNPIILKNFSGTYDDQFGNHAEGNFVGLTLMFKGSDSTITSKIDIAHPPHGELTIGSNCSVCLGKQTIMEMISGNLEDETYLQIGTKCIFKDIIIRMRKKSKLTIDDYTTTGKTLRINLFEKESKVSIGKDCLFSSEVTFMCGNGHSLLSLDSDNCSPHHEIVLEDHIWVGHKVILISGAHISEGSVVGIGALVSKKFPNNCTVAGVPAKIIRKNIAWGRNEYGPNLELCGKYIIPTQEDWDNSEEFKITYMMNHLENYSFCKEISDYLIKNNKPRDEIKHYLKLASQKNNAWTSLEYISFLSEGNQEDKELAVSECKRLFEESRYKRIKIEAAIRLSKFYHDGVGTQKDVQSAIKMIKFAAENGHNWSIVVYADYLSEVKESIDESSRLYVKVLLDRLFDFKINRAIINKILQNYSRTEINKRQIPSINTYLSALAPEELFLIKKDISKYLGRFSEEDINNIIKPYTLDSEDYQC